MEYQGYKVSGIKKVDTALLKMLQPYSDSLSNKMNIKLAMLTGNLEKSQPNGSMGLVFVDIMKAMAEKHFNTKVDAAFINNGGLRVPSVNAGMLTVGKVYEIMPFDNILIIQNVKGNVLEKFVQLIASKGGWPVSGIQFNIDNKTAKNIIVNGNPIDLNATYTIANSDYIANGGDDCTMLLNQPTVNNGYLLRDAFVAYFADQGKMGNKINPINEKRITK